MLNETLCTPTLALGGDVGFRPRCGRLRGAGVAVGHVGQGALAIRAHVPQKERREEGSRCFEMLSVLWLVSGCNSVLCSSFCPAGAQRCTSNSPPWHICFAVVAASL